MHPFRAYISLFVSISDQEWSMIHPHIHHKIIQSDRVILKPGSQCAHLYFLECGKVRYFKNEIASSVTLLEKQPPSIFSSIESFAHNTPSNFGIQAIEESSIWIVTKESASQLLGLPAWKQFLSSVPQI
ncbi:MAG: cyclic nucleotide-binding domain-containing protein [Saprospiraceae bacterium]|nr:cyclic nucleotide-binding domain-containing protein [Saprospiraceae bacterium]